LTQKTDVRQGTLTFMVFKSLEALGPLHGYGIARRIEQTSRDRLALNYGTVYPALLKLEHEGFITSIARRSNYRLTRAGRNQLKKETRQWEETTAIISRFLRPGEQSS